MTTIDQLTKRFNVALNDKEWEHCIDTCFHILYGLPETSQLELATIMVRRYLPIFQNRWPDTNWPQIILDQPSDWFYKHDREVPDEPEILNPADSAFIFCFDAILNAIAHPTNPLIVTSSYMSAINVAIDARSTNVWMADDPEAVEMWEKQAYFPGRSADENPAAIAVVAREWRIVGDWLFAEEHTKLFKSSSDKEVAQGLAQWKETEMSLIITSPTSANG